MKALLWHNRNDIRVEDVPEPDPGPGQVKIRVRWTGICGTDIHEYLHGPIIIPKEPHPVTGKSAPIIPGHEFCGVVADIGKEVTRFKTGDRVTADVGIACGKCFYCRRNQYILCEHAAYTGFSADGSMAEYVVVPDYACYKLTDAISDEAGSLIEPLSVAIHAVRRGEVSVGDTVAVVGAGPIGLVTLQAARAAGASRVFVLEKLAARKQCAERLGAAAVIDPADGDPVEQIKAQTDGLGVDVAFECVGRKETAPLTVSLTRKGGRAVIVGVFTEPSTFHFNDLVLAERDIRGSLAYAGEFAAAIALLTDGRATVDPLITTKIRLDDIITKGYRELIDHGPKYIKILVESE